MASTIDFVRELPFTDLHVFPYSPRPGTAAERLGARVAPEVVKRRAAELRALAREKAVAHTARRAGDTADVVVVGGGAKREGLTEDYLSVDLSDPSLPRRTRFDAELLDRGGPQLVATGVHPR